MLFIALPFQPEMFSQLFLFKIDMQSGNRQHKHRYSQYSSQATDAKSKGQLESTHTKVDRVAAPGVTSVGNKRGRFMCMQRIQGRTFHPHLPRGMQYHQQTDAGQQCAYHDIHPAECETRTRRQHIRNEKKY